MKQQIEPTETDAAEILCALVKAMRPLIDNGMPTDYIAYVLFRYTGTALKHEIDNEVWLRCIFEDDIIQEKDHGEKPLHLV